MSSALEQLIGATVIDASGKSVAVSSLAVPDKIIGQYIVYEYMPYLLYNIQKRYSIGLV